MRKSVKLAIAAAMVLGSTSAFATNGSTLIGLGAKSRGMAGTAIGVSHGAESALANPALITTIKKDHEVSFGGTLFMPNVKQSNSLNGSGTSKADKNVIPEVSIANKVTDNFYWGIGIWGTAGMGVDYRDSGYQNGNMKMVTNLQIMQFGVPLAYTTNGFSVAIAPILQYGALDINYDADTNASNGTTGAGVAQDLQLGWTIGLSYEMKGLTVGAVYKSQIDMNYKGQLSSATAPFVSFGVFPQAMGDKLSTPAEYGVGASYKFGGNTVALDWKQIKWSSAKGYKDFGWKDQNVIAVGYAYTTDGWAVRLGYNYAKNPIKDQGAMTLAQANAAAGGNSAKVPKYLGGNALNTFNLLGFPGIVESHIAVGGTYNISSTTSVDAAFTYAPQVSQTLQSFPADTNRDGYPDTDVKTTVKHSQTALTVQLNYAF